MTFQNEAIGECADVLQLLNKFFKENLQGIRFVDNAMTDAAFQGQLYPLLQNFQHLQKLEITNNHITLGSLETFGRLFPACRLISELNLSSNYIGGGSTTAAAGEKAQVELFLLKFFTELKHPKTLNLSYNSLTDESLYPLVKYIFANHACKLELFDLENNRLSP